MARVPINNGDDGLAVRNALNAMFTEIYAFAIANIAGLQPALDLKAPLASPALTGVPTAPTPANATNNTQIATTAFVQSLIAAIINSAPGALDTLDELAAALGDDANFAATMTTALAGKQPIDATLTALAALAGGADKLPYFTGVDVLAQADLTAFGRSVIALANAAALRTLINVADGATANSPDATLLARANHTGTQPASTISDFTEASQDVVGAMVTAAGGTYDDGAGTITLPGGGYTDEQVRDVIGAALVAGTNITITVNDAGDTITIDAAGGSGVDEADPTVAQTYRDDLLAGSAETGEIGELGWSFTNGTITKLDGVQSHPGIVRHNGSTTANQVCSFYLGNAVGDQVCRFDEWSEATVIFKEAAAAQTDMTLQLGVFEAMGNTAPAHGVYLEIKPADTNYFFVCRNGGVETRTDSGVARTTNWIKVKMRKSGANIVFNINGGADVTITTNVPDAADTICIGKQSAQTGTTARNVDLDWLSFKMAAITR